MKTPAISLALGSLLLLACNGNTSATRTDERAPAVSTSSVVVRPAVAWPAASSIDEGALVALSRSGDKSESDIRALVSRSPVPVLAPKELRLSAPTLVVEGEYFALTGRVDAPAPSAPARATINIQGTRAAHRYESVEPTAGTRDLARGANIRGFVSVNEGIRNAAWIENGTAYSVDVECSDHTDARCQSEDFLLSIIAQLTFIGGSGR
jgi:hypothetical protein